MEKYSFRYAFGAGPLQARAQLAAAVADDFVQGGHHVGRLFAVLLGDGDLFGRSGEFVEHAEALAPRRRVARTAGEEEALAAVLFADFVFVGQVIAHRAHVEIAGLDDGFDGLGQRRFHALLLVLRQPGRVVFEILGVLRQLDHQAVQFLIGDADEALRRAFGGARVAVDLDEAVGEIHAAGCSAPRRCRTESSPRGRRSGNSG